MKYIYFDSLDMTLYANIVEFDSFNMDPLYDVFDLGQFNLCFQYTFSFSEYLKFI